MLLRRPECACVGRNESGSDSGGAALGVRVVGGQRTESGRLGAFIVRVKRGTVADLVGRLRAGDEVLEWNGAPLQHLSASEVSAVLSQSRHCRLIELVVQRTLPIADPTAPATAAGGAAHDDRLSEPSTSSGSTSARAPHASLALLAQISCADIMRIIAYIYN